MIHGTDSGCKTDGCRCQSDQEAWSKVRPLQPPEGRKLPKSNIGQAVYVGLFLKNISMKKIILTLLIFLPLICFSQIDGERDTSLCAVRIWNLKKCTSRYTRAYEVMRYEEATQSWVREVYLYYDSRKKIRQTRNKCIVFIESLM